MARNDRMDQDEERVRDVGRNRSNMARQQIEDLKSVMSQPYGRRFMWSLLESTGMFRTSFTGNATTYFNEGMRNVGLKVVGDLGEHCPELYLLMQQEHLKGEHHE